MSDISDEEKARGREKDINRINDLLTNKVISADLHKRFMAICYPETGGVENLK